MAIIPERDSPETGKSLSSQPSPQAAPAARILIVEDEGIIANHIAARLSKTGYEVAGIAESSEEALEKITESKPDLVLMDIRIKGAMDGIETATTLRDSFDIPVIYLTAHSDQETIDRAKTTGAAGFLMKPIHHTSLATSIEMALHKHRADRGIREQRAWMATILGTMADAMLVIDRERRVQFINLPAEQLTGWSRESAGGQDIALVLPLTDSLSGAPAAEPLLPDSATQLRHGLIARKRLGSWFAIEGEIAPSVDGSGIDGKKVVGAVITFRDATARQEHENEIRHEYKMQAVGRLAAGIAHDFNNLLLIILGYADELLRKSALGDYERIALTEIRNAGDDAANITQQLLSFTRREHVEKQDVNLNDIIRDTSELFRRPGGPAVEWRFLLDPDLGPVRADHGQLKQLLMNLVANARDAMPEGGNLTIETASVAGPRAALSTRAVSSDDSPATFIALSVTDTGIGMTPDTAEHLFEPFFTTKGPGNGKGLGLSIVHGIVMDLGGTLQVDSEPGKGSTFSVYLPRTCAETAAPPGGAAVPKSSDSCTILLVEDQEAIRNLVRDYLESSGYRVIEAEDGAEAQRKANEADGPIDLLITDVVLAGGVGGFAVARALAARTGMKTVFISGYAEELLDGREILPPGAKFLPKPFAKGDLLKTVRDLLRTETHTVSTSA